MKIHLRNGRVMDPSTGLDIQGDVFIAAGKVAAIGARPEGFVANRTIDAAGLVVCPGLVDLSARLREPGQEYKATLESEMRSAMAGGVTSLACPPDTDPPLDEPGLVEMLKYRARHPNFARVYPIGALTIKLEGERLTEMAELHEAGCVAFSQAQSPIFDTQVLLHALQYAATFDFPVWLQAQDPFLGKKGVAHDGEVATRLGLPSIPTCAETIALSTILQLARETGVRIHLTRISSAASLEMIVAARRAGIAVTCDVSINHLHLVDDDIGFFNPHARLVPPLRGLSDRQALRQGLAEGAVNALCSDHTPVDDDAKQLPFSEAEPGATGLELLLPLALKWGEALKLPLATVLSRITADPARILGIRAGTLCVGSVADICVFDPASRFVVTREMLKSQGKNTPFLGVELTGRVRYTFLDGHLAYEGPL